MIDVFYRILHTCFLLFSVAHQNVSTLLRITNFWRVDMAAISLSTILFYILTDESTFIHWILAQTFFRSARLSMAVKNVGDAFNGIKIGTEEITVLSIGCFRTLLKPSLFCELHHSSSASKTNTWSEKYVFANEELWRCEGEGVWESRWRYNLVRETTPSPCC